MPHERRWVKSHAELRSFVLFYTQPGDTLALKLPSFPLRWTLDIVLPERNTLKKYRYTQRPFIVGRGSLPCRHRSVYKQKSSNPGFCSLLCKLYVLVHDTSNGNLQTQHDRGHRSTLKSCGAGYAFGREATQPGYRARTVPTMADAYRHDSLAETLCLVHQQGTTVMAINQERIQSSSRRRLSILAGPSPCVQADGLGDASIANQG